MTLNYQLVKEKKLQLSFPSELFINGNYQKSLSDKIIFVENLGHLILKSGSSHLIVSSFLGLYLLETL